MFADDTKLFHDADQETVKIIRCVFLCFEVVLGLNEFCKGVLVWLKDIRTI